jgi:hypothetical protein
LSRKVSRRPNVPSAKPGRWTVTSPASTVAAPPWLLQDARFTGPASALTAADPTANAITAASGKLARSRRRVLKIDMSTTLEAIRAQFAHR